MNGIPDVYIGFWCKPWQRLYPRELSADRAIGVILGESLLGDRGVGNSREFDRELGVSIVASPYILFCNAKKREIQFHVTSGPDRMMDCRFASFSAFAPVSVPGALHCSSND